MCAEAVWGKFLSKAPHGSPPDWAGTECGRGLEHGGLMGRMDVNRVFGTAAWVHFESCTLHPPGWMTGKCRITIQCMQTVHAFQSFPRPYQRGSVSFVDLKRGNLEQLSGYLSWSNKNFHCCEPSWETCQSHPIAPPCQNSNCCGTMNSDFPPSPPPHQIVLETPNAVRFSEKPRLQPTPHTKTGKGCHHSVLQSQSALQGKKIAQPCACIEFTPGWWWSRLIQSSSGGFLSFFFGVPFATGDGNCVGWGLFARWIFFLLFWVGWGLPVFHSP